MALYVEPQTKYTQAKANAIRDLTEGGKGDLL
jgi:hypothetical protein